MYRNDLCSDQLPCCVSEGGGGDIGDGGRNSVGPHSIVYMRVL